MLRKENNYLFQCETIGCNCMATHSILLEDEGLQVYSCESHKTSWTREIKKAYTNELYIVIHTNENGFEEDVYCV